MKRQPMTVRDLIKVLEKFDPLAYVRTWDLGYGGSVPVVTVDGDKEGPVFIEGATKEEMDHQ